MNDYHGVRIEYHILQSFPVTCLNRDDVGSPKTAVVGGVERGRVSSQCWKRQVRLALRDLGIHIGIRTKRVAELIEENCLGDCSHEKKDFISHMAAAIQSKDTLFFISENELKALAQYADGVVDYQAELKKKKLNDNLATTLSKLIKDCGIKGLSSLDGLDIALFGRMAANSTELNVTAASSFSHAITTHRISSSVDYFTAVDEFAAESNETRVGHIHSNEFSSGTYYRYISLDLGVLTDNLGGAADLSKAVEAFTRALYVAVPAARQTTFAGYCPWDYAHILVRKGQPLSLSFEKPVTAKGEGYFTPSRIAMEDSIARNEKLFGSMYGKVAEFVYGDDDEFGIDQLCKSICDVIGRS